MGRFEISLDLSRLAPGPKDILDAAAAAITAREFDAHRAMAVGGGDGLGEIVLPKAPTQIIEEVLKWPGRGEGSEMPS